jgi:putative flippase GtrA
MHTGKQAPWWSGSRREVLRALRTHESGLLGQGARFAIAGATVMGVYLTSTTVLADVIGLPFQVALVIGFCVGLIVHFTLQRTFVWSHAEEFALPLHHQAARYLTVAAIQYGLTAASTALLPRVLGVSTEIDYLATVAAITATNFLVFRHGIFHPQEALAEPADGAAEQDGQQPSAGNGSAVAVKPSSGEDDEGALHARAARARVPTQRAAER